MLAGVDITASIVPRSHSRATTSAVSSVPINVMMIAMAPGIRKWRLLISGLNQNRGANRDRAARPIRRAAQPVATTPLRVRCRRSSPCSAAIRR